MDAARQLALAERAFESGDIERAEALLRPLLARFPGNSRVNELMGYIAGHRGDVDRAYDFLAAATRAPGASAESWYYLGSTLLQKGRYAEAASALGTSLALAGDFFEGLHDLAVALTRSGRAHEAIGLFDKAQALRRDSIELLNNKGIALHACRRFEQAIQAYERALALDAAHPSPWLNKGVSLHELGRYDEALSAYEKALQLKPDYAEAWCNKGNSAYQLNRPQEALEHYGRALSVDHEDADSRYGEALALLVQGRLGEGFERFECRWRKTDADVEHHFDTPKWLGDRPLAGKRILLWAEQGYGDSLQFCRYAPLVARMGGEVTVEVQPALKDLVATLGECAVVAQGERLEGFDYQAPLLSLPLALGTKLETIPSAVPYLRADPHKLQQWQNRMDTPGTRPRIAIACSGRPSHKNDRNRSMALSHFAPLQEMASLFLVQKDLRESDRLVLGQSPGIRFLGEDIRDFQDTAAIVSLVDLVVTVDTSLAHVAGALAKPVWILLPWAPEWRWLLQRTDTPWYPTAKLFRQERMDDWHGVMGKVLHALRQRQ
jgi:tetratricopeptide (TPR) repeat protein